MAKLIRLQSIPTPLEAHGYLCAATHRRSLLDASKGFSPEQDNSSVGPMSALGQSLFRTSRETPSDHLDFVERARSSDIQRLLIRPAECDILAVCRRAAHLYDAEMLALRAQDLDTAAGGDVEPVVV